MPNIPSYVGQDGGIPPTYLDFLSQIVFRVPAKVGFAFPKSTRPQPQLSEHGGKTHWVSVARTPQKSCTFKYKNTKKN